MVAKATQPFFFLFLKKTTKRKFFLKQTMTVVEHQFSFRQCLNYLLFFFMLLELNHQFWRVILLRFTVMSNICVRVCVCASVGVCVCACVRVCVCIIAIM